VSEFTESYHLQADDQQAGVHLLQWAHLDGFVFPPQRGWVTILPRSEFGEMPDGLVEANEGWLLRYLLDQDTGWMFQVYSGPILGSSYECCWLDWSPEKRPSWMRDGMEVQLYEGRGDLEVVGEASYQDNLWRIIRERRSPDGRVREEVYAVLAAEPDNPYDANAVAVWIQGLKVGYLSREDARRYRPGLQALEQQHGKPIALAGVIAGGGMRADGPGRLGVLLEHDPADFGLRRCR
jgi:HIRAN domain